MLKNIAIVAGLNLVAGFFIGAVSSVAALAVWGPDAPFAFIPVLAGAGMGAFTCLVTRPMR